MICRRMMLGAMPLSGEIKRISLAEFSRLYLCSLDAARDNSDAPSMPAASPRVSEDNFAVQVVLGMAKNAEKASRMTAP
jgi:hypothetical protein